MGVENTGVGYQVFSLNTPGAGNVAVGAYSQQKVTATASSNVSIGVLTLNSLTVGVSNFARVATGDARDGSKKRNRYHHWFVAQEVKELCDKLGVEFGGYQDHSVNDGDDVLTLGYDEFIPPTVRAVQQCWNRLDELEKRIAKLE